MPSVSASTVPTSYAAITHREPMRPSTLPILGAMLTRYSDPLFDTRIIRVTDARLEGNNIFPNVPISGSNGNGRFYTTPAASERAAWSAGAGSAGTGYLRFYVQSQNGINHIFRLNTTNFTLSREPKSSNNPGDGTNMHLSGMSGESQWSYINPDLIYGAQGAVIKNYNFATDIYTPLKDLSTYMGTNWPTGPNPDYGTYMGYVAASDKLTNGNERILFLFGAGNQDYHYLTGVAEAQNWNSTMRIFDSRRMQIGTPTAMTDLPNSALSQFDNPNWGTLQASVAASGAVTLSVQNFSASGFNWPKTGVVLIGQERMRYSKNSETSLTVAAADRGAFGTLTAMHSSGDAITLTGCDMHTPFISRDGRYVLLVRAYRNNRGGSAYQNIIWDVSTDTFTRMSDPSAYSGHVSLGFNQFINENSCTGADPLQWQIRSLSAPNGGGTCLVQPESYGGNQSGTVISNYDVGEHTSWANNKKQGEPSRSYRAPIGITDCKEHMI